MTTAENTKLVQDVYAAFGRGDIPAVVNMMSDDIDWQAIVGALGRLGFGAVSDVRQGKRFELEVDDSIDDDTLAEIAESLLANTVIEDWSVSREQS